MQVAGPVRDAHRQQLLRGHVEVRAHQCRPRMALHLLHRPCDQKAVWPSLGAQAVVEVAGHEEDLPSAWHVRLRRTTLAALKARHTCHEHNQHLL